MNDIITRHRHEGARRRDLCVDTITQLTPHMLRVELSGDMEGFASLSPDDHIKLFFQTGAEKPAMRDYTPRSFDVPAGRLTVDFALHEAGPATDWARHARPGDILSVGGPRGSAVISRDVDWWLLVGDETALPAIGRRIEEAAAGTPIRALVAVPSIEDRQELSTEADLQIDWVIRPVTVANDPSPLLKALRGISLPTGRGFVWIAAEARVARALRDCVRDEFGHPADRIKAAGYWTSGLADTSDKALD